MTKSIKSKLEKMHFYIVWLTILLQYPLWWVFIKTSPFQALHVFRFMFCTYDMEIKARKWWEIRLFPITYHCS